MSPDQIATALNVLGVTGLLAIAVLAFYKGWVVSGNTHKAVERERDEWKAMALDGFRTVADVAAASKAHTTLTPEQAEAALRVIREAKR